MYKLYVTIDIILYKEHVQYLLVNDPDSQNIHVLVNAMYMDDTAEWRLICVSVLSTINACDETKPIAFHNSRPITDGICKVTDTAVHLVVILRRRDEMTHTIIEHKTSYHG